jgi:hypothetical protein
MEQLAFQLIDRVIFMDWNGVLSSSPFWQSMQPVSPKGSLQIGLMNRLEEIFAHDVRLSEAWMRGERTTADLFADIRNLQGARRTADFLERRLIDDCLRMVVDAKLFAALGHAKLRVPIVLATDNTEDFAKAFDRAKTGKSWLRRRDGREADATLSDVTRHFFDIICSARVGVLKAEDPVRFFGTWLAHHALTFKDALLVDDRLDNIEAFRKAGGSTLRWCGTERAAEVIPDILEWARNGKFFRCP